MEFEARRIGLKRLEAHYFSKNLAAEHLYLNKMGYIVEGVKNMEGILFDGTYDDGIMIVKFLK